MIEQVFNVIVETQISKIKSTLVTKAKEYATDDRLYNFKKAAEEFGGTPTEVCWGYMLKHLTSVMDIAKGVRSADIPTIEEKIGDSINYLILLKALLIEQISNDPNYNSRKEG